MFRDSGTPRTGKELDTQEKEAPTVQNWLSMWAPVILGWIIYTGLLKIATQ